MSVTDCHDSVANATIKLSTTNKTKKASAFVTNLVEQEKFF
jgi:hypothetical protein